MGRSAFGRGWYTWRTHRTCWSTGAHGRYVQEGAGEAVGVSQCIRVILEVVGQRWVLQDASGSVGLAWEYVRRQGNVDRLGVCRVSQQHIVQEPDVLEGHAGVLWHIVSGRDGGW